MKRRQYPRMLILAATVITALFLITPVCWAYVPPGGGGGSSGGTSSGSESAAGSGENTYSSTVSSGTWTPAGDGLNQVVFRNSPTPVSAITIKLPDPVSGTPPAPLPVYHVSAMSGINTNKLISNMQKTPGPGSGTAVDTSLFYQGLGQAAATDPSYQTSAVNLKNSGTMSTPVVGAGVNYQITPQTFPNLEYNYAFSAVNRIDMTNNKPDLTNSNKVITIAAVNVPAHTIKVGVGFSR